MTDEDDVYITCPEGMIKYHLMFIEIGIDETYGIDDWIPNGPYSIIGYDSVKDLYGRLIDIDPKSEDYKWYKRWIILKNRLLKNGDYE